jgi:3-methylcrotonyl-CoA carboxylase alpha subunit
MGQAAVEAAKRSAMSAPARSSSSPATASRTAAFYFMEMNTRLQVEHPVTEMITGQDLVEWQLRVAAASRCRCAQEQLEIRGHALEARIYAENPEQGVPAVDRHADHLARPAESINVRVDTGVEEGDEITPFYDPMIAKLIVWDVDRPAALARMRQALADYRIVGVTTNIDFLSRLVACPAFANADLDTGLIERSRDFLFPARSEPPSSVFFVAAVAGLLREHAGSPGSCQSLGRPLVAVEPARRMAAEPPAAAHAHLPQW